ncbi:hypothetical protein [Streptosporangium subroseum]|uniref:hypothetical protein n=1 Tax=Streptosporangium subroseum TaxID=106412 RepID=UPI003087F863|nr:hypothetical protein OHB15_32250 [Streptosporangium subroseum]
MRIHGTITVGTLTHAYADPEETAARARAAGVPLRRPLAAGVDVPAGRRRARAR